MIGALEPWWLIILNKKVTKLLTLFLVFFIFLSIPTHAKITGKVTKRYFNRQIQEIIFYSEKTPISTYYLDNSSNIQKISGDNLDGTFLVYHENNILAANIPLKEGKVNGLVFYYYKNGRLEAEYNYLNGKKHGSYKIYYDNGFVQQEGNFISNHKKKNNNNQIREFRTVPDKNKGVLRIFQSNLDSLNDELDEMSNYSMPDGLIKSYNRSGQIEFIDFYKDGKIVSTQAFDRAGNLKWERKY
ncbi:MAG: hypothetical protein KKA19_01155 [Candidatus Margulisbacteria bacterium]|nr:hypothetical protein [Candidatus Margulisiibacteriota bacterium]